MIDIHCHLLFGVDDGSKSIKESVAMLKEAKAQQVDAMILTPHYRHGMFPFDGKRIDSHFKELLSYAKEVGVQIYLGCEYYVNGKIVEYIRSGRCRALAGSNYVLTEYAYEEDFAYIETMSRNLIEQGYIPIIAHAERCACLEEMPMRSRILREAGAQIQLNCDAVLGIDGREARKFSKKLLSEGLVDYVASDSHGIKDRVCHMRACNDYISRKYGQDIAVRLMEENPRRIITASGTYKGTTQKIHEN
ncbi:MAG: PHP domain-containing protein [Clostridiales bacterium]|nr:PHP domain-containing protein [Clostridiales bacterium]